MFDAKLYEPGGPVIKSFHESGAFYRGVAGPIGSSKTTAAGPAEAAFGAMVQRPSSDDIRRFKLGVLRDTYRNLYATTMKTWNYWWPRDLGSFTGSDDRPANHKFQLDTPLGRCEVEAEFRALGASLDVEATCRGWELNGAYCDEADLMPQEAVTYLGGRVQRAGDVNLRQTKGVSFTFNKPDVDHWLYGMCEENAFDGDFRFFDQPGGLLPGLPYRTNPSAENLKHLDPDYYVISATGQPEWYVRRMIRNEWGASISGERIYPGFQRERHVSPVSLTPPPGSILRLGLDGGGTPAAVIVGRDMQGRRICYAEVVLIDPNDPRGRKLRQGVGAKRFAEAIADKLSEPRFRGCCVEIGFGDPAAFYGADREAGEYSFMEAVGLHLKVPVIPTDSNEVGIRHSAVEGLLYDSSPIDGLPMLVIDPSCTWLIRGFVSDYKWETADPKQPGKRLKAQKSATSHVHDALQYECLGDVGRAGVVAGKAFDRWGGKHTGLLAIPSAPSLVQPFPDGRVKAVVAGTHYKVDFKLW